MRNILVYTEFGIQNRLRFMIISLLILITGCSKNEDYSESDINLSGVINFRTVGVADFSMLNSRASIAPTIVDTIQLADSLYAEVSISEASEVSTRANTVPNLPKNTCFRLLALDNSVIKADIVYRIMDDNGRAEIVSGSGEGYKIGDDGKKYLQLSPGKTYKMVGFSDGTSNSPDNFTDPKIYEWKSNYMKFSTTLVVADGVNQFGPIFQHMNAAMQVVINSEATGGNVTAASAVVWQENNMPVNDQWSYLTDTYANNPTKNNGSETNGLPVVWGNPNGQQVTSDLQFLTPGTYGSLKLKLANIRVGGVTYRHIETISLDADKMNLIERNRKYLITLKFISPTEIRPLNIFVVGCSMTDPVTRYGVSDQTGYDIATGRSFKSGQELPANLGEYSYIRFSSTCVGIFENPEYFGRHATYTQPIGKFNAVKWWSASRPNDITAANLKKSKIDMIFYSSEHLVNVYKNGTPYVNLITSAIANELYNYHRDNVNTGLILISGNPSSYGPSTSYPNYFIQKFFGPIDVNNTSWSAISYNAIPPFPLLHTGNAAEANAVMPGVGDFIFTNGVFSASGGETLRYGPIPQNRALHWTGIIDAEDYTYHDAAYSSYLITSKLKAIDPNWVSVFYGEQDWNNTNLNTAVKDVNKTVLAYNPKLRIVWTPGASQWGYPHGTNCSARYAASLNYSGPMNAWTRGIRPVYINPLLGTPDNSGHRNFRRYGSRAMYGCVADMIIRNNIGGN